MPSLAIMKLIGIGVGVLAVIFLFTMVMGWKHDAAERKAKLEVICQATRDASGQPKLACGEVPKQIKFMGEAIGTLTTAINKQNAAVQAMGDDTARQQAAAAKAVQNAAGRAHSAEATAERLRASARAGGAVAKPCEPSKVLSEAWQ